MESQEGLLLPFAPLSSVPGQYVENVAPGKIYLRLKNFADRMKFKNPLLIVSCRNNWLFAS